MIVMNFPGTLHQCFSHASRGLVALIAVSVVVACGSTSLPATQYFLLATPDSEALPSAADRGIDVGSVALPAYLNQLGIVLVSASRQVNIARFNLWAEPLDEGIMSLLEQEFNARDSQPSLRLEIRINFLHGDETGQVLLDADWTLRDDCGGSFRGRSRQSTRQESAGYAELVESHDRLLTQMATAIRTGAAAMPEPAAGAGCRESRD